jgi:phage terminase large subunit
MESLDVVQERVKRLLLLRERPEYLTASKLIYKDDPVKFINDWFITYNPQVRPATIPFILFPKQQELIRFFHERNTNREDGLCEKCRNVGFTWLAIAYALWLFIFQPEQKISFGSRKQDLVDKIGDPDSIFEKIRLALKFLPKEFLPVGFDLNEHAPFLRIKNPENGSVITGEAGDNIGRGGRSTIYFLDEAAFLEHPDKVEAAVSENSECKIYISTPNGIGNVFYRHRFGGMMPVFTFHWYDDPRKDQAWFDKKKATLDPVIFAQEVLISYTASIDNVCIPADWVHAAINFDCKGLEEGSIICGLDVADEGRDANAIVMRKGHKIFFIESWYQGNTTQTARRAYATCENKKSDYLFYDSPGVGAGIKGELSSLVVPDKNKIVIRGINTGAEELKGYFEKSGKKNEDMFLNMRAYLWWSARRRFEKTYEHVKGIKEYPPHELISIPRNSELINELSQPLFFFSDNGKIKIESKKDMRTRGVKSPNIADAFMLSYVPYSLPSIRTL